jgi:hypothetical protein
MTYTYQTITDDLSQTQTIKRTDENGSVLWIPIDESNSDYLAYLKRDEAETI